MPIAGNILSRLIGASRNIDIGLLLDPLVQLATSRSETRTAARAPRASARHAKCSRVRGARRLRSSVRAYAARPRACAVTPWQWARRCGGCSRSSPRSAHVRGCALRPLRRHRPGARPQHDERVLDVLSRTIVVVIDQVNVVGLVDYDVQYSSSALGCST